MREFDTSEGGLPVALGPGAPRSTVAVAPGAPFLSQLIAERYRMSTQRHRRRETVPTALDIYAVGAEKSVRRLPPGYRMSRDA
ncbi:MAG: hypothetical protein ABI697_04010 [Devosia sp.]